MTCFLLNDPKAVFIHIPKTAGTSVRAMWTTPTVRRCYGHIPPDWLDAMKFAIVRDPEARFLSAVKMFKYGSTGVDGMGEAPRMPDLDVDQALDVVDNPRVPFDRIQSHLRGNLKHHLLPQTHPFNCLHLADHVLRQETLKQDISKLGLEGLSPLAQMRIGVAETGDLTLNEGQRARLHRLFEDDYAQLGYGIDGQIARDVAVKRPPVTGVWPLWPAFFSDRDIRLENASDALPLGDVDLRPFVEDVIAGVPKSTWPARSDNLIEHFHKLLPECVGQARIAHLAACCIVVIRRTKGREGLTLFQRIINTHADVVFADMNSRWLTSVADTLADHGQNPVQRALGLCASLLSGAVKLAETERLIYAVPRPWPPKARLGEDGVMFDGVISFWGQNGDMIENLLERVTKSVDLDPIGGQLVLEMTSRILRHDTVFRRSAELSGVPDVPYISQDLRARLNRIARKHL